MNVSDEFGDQAPGRLCVPANNFSLLASSSNSFPTNRALIIGLVLVSLFAFTHLVPILIALQSISELLFLHNLVHLQLLKRLQLFLLREGHHLRVEEFLGLAMVHPILFLHAAFRIHDGVVMSLLIQVHLRRAVKLQDQRLNKGKSSPARNALISCIIHFRIQ